MMMMMMMNKNLFTDGWAKDDLVYEWIPEGPVQVLMITMMINIIIRDSLKKFKNREFW